MADRLERTPEEREEARLERERRRGSPDGTPPQDVVDQTVPEEQPVHPADDDGDWLGEDEQDEEEEGDEVAVGTRRVDWRERPARAPRPTRPKRSRPPSSPRRKFAGRAIASLVLVLAAAVIWFFVELFQPFHGPGHGSVTVTIPPRTGAHQVGDLLARDGVVSSGFFFYLRSKLEGDTGKLLAGTYHLKRDMSYAAALKALMTPPPQAKVTNVTVIPGETRVQIDSLLRSQGVAGSYLAATRRSRLLPPADYGAPAPTRSLEGFLFPDTYQLRVPITIGALVADQLTQFKQVFSHVNMSYARRHGLTPYDVLNIASIVEKEASTARDRPLVASVIYNRLKDRMPLGMDSTTRYEFNDYTKPLTQSQLASPSPYNTRLHVGLPPTPIDSPGLASIEAAAHPPQTNYLYFVVKPCGNGEMVFSSDYNHFLADEARYQAARSARGGNAPNKC